MKETFMYRDSCYKYGHRVDIAGDADVLLLDLSMHSIYDSPSFDLVTKTSKGTPLAISCRWLQFPNDMPVDLPDFEYGPGYWFEGTINLKRVKRLMAAGKLNKK